MIDGDVANLIHELGRITGARPVAMLGLATDDEIRRFESLHNITLPSEVKAWFQSWSAASVSSIGYMGFSGFNTLFSVEEDDCSVDWYFKMYPEWKEKGWIPITDDGCGDLYILTTSVVIPSAGTHPVFFLDQSGDNPAYVTASGLWKFLFFLLENEVRIQSGDASYWPFDERKVTANDPCIVECREIPLPWEADMK